MSGMLIGMECGRAWLTAMARKAWGRWLVGMECNACGWWLIGMARKACGHADSSEWNARYVEYTWFNAIFLTNLETTVYIIDLTRFFLNNFTHRSIYHRINAIFVTILGGNGTQGMRAADSSEWHAKHAGAWLTAMTRMVCGRADSSELDPRNFENAWITAIFLTILETVYYHYNLSYNESFWHITSGNVCFVFDAHSITFRHHPQYER